MKKRIETNGYDVFFSITRHGTALSSLEDAEGMPSKINSKASGRFAIK